MSRAHNLSIPLLIWVIAALACNFGAAPTAVPDTPTPFPATDTPAPLPPTPTEPPAPTPALAAPTVTPLPEATPTRGAISLPAVIPKPTLAAVQPGGASLGQSPQLRLDSVAFVHPAGLFAVFPPLGWTVETGDASASFEAPDFSGFIYVQVTNTGYELDEVAFDSFVRAREVNRFADYEEYEEITYEIDAAWGIAAVTKQLTFDGVPQYVITYYDQYDLAIYSVDMWLDADRVDAYATAYDEIFETMEVNSSAVAELDTYMWIHTFTGPAELFTIEIPIAWQYVRDEGPNVIVDTFYAPDGHAVIQNVSYDDGTVVTKSMAGSFALELLKTYYASDIRITDDRVQPDGSERLTWHSRSGDYSGVSFFETRGTTFLLFTTMYDNPYEDVYLDVLNYTISTYLIP
jgi:hypothetical protein